MHPGTHPPLSESTEKERTKQLFIHEHTHTHTHTHTHNATHTVSPHTPCRATVITTSQYYVHPSIISPGVNEQ